MTNNKDTDLIPYCLSALVPKKIAFTLAEVLITLGVIGVVAAITIPSLIKTYQEKVTVNKVKKMYSTLNQALKLAINDYGEVSLWDYGGGNRWTQESAEKFWNYFKTYFKIARDCKAEEKCTINTIKFLDDENYEYTTNYDSSTNYKKIILNDGSLLWFRTNGEFCQYSDARESNVCAILCYDVNGIKKPNTLGKDIFVFQIKSNAVATHPYDDCSLNIAGGGWGCSRYIIKNGNMNYLHKK